MKRVLPSLLLCAGSLSAQYLFAGFNPGGGGGGGSVTLVQSKASTNNFCGGGSTCLLAALTSGATAGNAIVACIRWNLTSSTGINITAMSDDKGDTGTVVAGTKKTAAGGTQNEIGVQCGWIRNVTAGATAVTFTLSAAVNGNDGSTWETTPINAVPVDQTATATGTMSGGSNPPATGSVTTGTNGEFAVVMTQIDDGFGGGGVFNAGSGWTILQNTGGGNMDSASEHQAQTTAGALNGNFTSPGNNGVWVVAIMTLKP
jgi:hypothetical protein